MKKSQWVSTIIYIIIFIAGIIILLKDVHLGDQAILRYMQSKGGHTGNYEVYLEQFIWNYRFIGAIVASIGGLGIVLNVRMKS